MIEEDHGAEAECHFCRNTYDFSEEELENYTKKLIKKKGAPNWLLLFKRG